MQYEDGLVTGQTHAHAGGLPHDSRRLADITIHAGRNGWNDPSCLPLVKMKMKVNTIYATNYVLVLHRSKPNSVEPAGRTDRLIFACHHCTITAFTDLATVQQRLMLTI